MELAYISQWHVYGSRSHCHIIVCLLRDQVKHYCQEKLMPRILMANRKERTYVSHCFALVLM